MTDQVVAHVILKNIDLSENREYLTYRKEQEALDILSRRPQSTLARYAYE